MSSKTLNGCVYIYGLVDPRDRLVYYVGKSKYPQRRRSTHICDARNGKTRPVHEWIRSLLMVDLTPEVEIFDKVSDLSWQYHERFWIDRKRSENPRLTNVTMGGEGLDSETASRVNRGRVLSDESRSKISTSLTNHFATCEPSVRKVIGTYHRTNAHVRRVRETTGKLTEPQVEEIERLYASGERQTEIAARFGVSQTLVSRIITGKAWKRRIEK